MDDTASFTALAALDPATPRFLRIAGDQLSAREIVALVSEMTGKKYRLFRPGRLGTLGMLIKVARYPCARQERALPGVAGHAVHA